MTNGVSADGRFDGSAWLDRLCAADARLDRELLRRAFDVRDSSTTETTRDRPRAASNSRDLMAELRMDATSIAAGWCTAAFAAAMRPLAMLERDVDA